MEERKLKNAKRDPQAEAQGQDGRKKQGWPLARGSLREHPRAESVEILHWVSKSRGWLGGPPAKSEEKPTRSPENIENICEIDELVTQSKSKGGQRLTARETARENGRKLPQAHRLGVCQIAHPQARTEKVESAKRDPQAEYMKWTDGKCFGMERLRPAQAAPIDLAMHHPSLRGGSPPPLP